MKKLDFGGKKIIPILDYPTEYYILVMANYHKILCILLGFNNGFKRTHFFNAEILNKITIIEKKNYKPILQTILKKNIYVLQK